jgi:hypothetical protein
MEPVKEMVRKPLEFAARNTQGKRTLPRHSIELR